MRRWHIFLAGIVLVLFSASFYVVPKYNDYLSRQDMRIEVEWAETWNVIRYTLPEGTDLNEYILMRKIEDTDIEKYTPQRNP